MGDRRGEAEEFQAPVAAVNRKPKVGWPSLGQGLMQGQRLVRLEKDIEEPFFSDVFLF